MTEEKIIFEQSYLEPPSRRTVDSLWSECQLEDSKEKLNFSTLIALLRPFRHENWRSGHKVMICPKINLSMSNLRKNLTKMKSK